MTVMHSDLHTHFAAATAHERERTFRAAATAPEPVAWAAAPIIALRLARADDEPTVAGLAELDDAPPLASPAMLAVVDGRPVAAGSLADGRVVADPFASTTDAVALLRARIAGLQDRHPRRRWRRVRVMRPAW